MSTEVATTEKKALYLNDPNSQELELPGVGTILLSVDLLKRNAIRGRAEFVTNQEALFALAICRARKLNPFTAEVYFIKYGQNDPLQTVVAKDTLLARAESHPDFLGYDAGIVVWDKGSRQMIQVSSTIIPPEMDLVGGWAHVFKKGEKRYPVLEVSLDEYQGKKSDGEVTKMWRLPKAGGKAATMIRKVALCQALREAFPEALGRMYDADEIVQPDEMGPGKAYEVTEVTETKESPLDALARQGREQKVKCDGNHGGPPCADPECWARDELPRAALRGMAQNATPTDDVVALKPEIILGSRVVTKFGAGKVILLQPPVKGYEHRGRVVKVELDGAGVAGKETIAYEDEVRPEVGGAQAEAEELETRARRNKITFNGKEILTRGVGEQTLIGIGSILIAFPQLKEEVLKPFYDGLKLRHHDATFLTEAEGQDVLQRLKDSADVLRRAYAGETGEAGPLNESEVANEAAAQAGTPLPVGLVDGATGPDGEVDRLMDCPNETDPVPLTQCVERCPPAFSSTCPSWEYPDGGRCRPTTKL